MVHPSLHCARYGAEFFERAFRLTAAASFRLLPGTPWVSVEVDQPELWTSLWMEGAWHLIFDPEGGRFQPTRLCDSRLPLTFKLTGTQNPEAGFVFHG